MITQCCLGQSQRPSMQRGELVGSEEEGDFCHMQELDPGWQKVEDIMNDNFWSDM